MEAVIRCPNCARKLRLREEVAGKRVRCPVCATVFQPSDVPATGRAASAGPSFTVGSRALAPWLDQYLYPATIVAIDGDECQVAYDDGDRQAVPRARLAPISATVGERIFIRPHAETRLMYFPAIVTRVAGEMVDVQFEGNEIQPAHVEQNLSLRRARFLRGPGPASQPTRPPAGATLYAVGDRALARWVDLFWYPATVIAVDDEGYSVLYDDGGQRVVAEAQLMPITVEEGEHIFIRPRGESRLVYFPAVVTRVDGETVDVEFEANEHMDAHAETNLKIARARFWRCPRHVPLDCWHEGDRVFALLDDTYWYPAEIISLEDDRIGLQLLFGGEGLVTPELIRKLEATPGMRVECRWRGEEHYYPGTLAAVAGDKVEVDYDDGATETTVVRLIRVMKGDLDA